MATKKLKTKSHKKRLPEEFGITRLVTRDEIIQEIDEGARKLIGMSAEQMLRAYRKGILEDPGFVGHLLIYSDLLPKNDPIFGPPRRTTR